MSTKTEWVHGKAVPMAMPSACTGSRLPQLSMIVGAALVTCILVLAGATISGAEPGLSGVQSMPSLVGSRAVSSASYGAISCPTASSCTAVGPAVQDGFFHDDVSPSVVTSTSGSWGTPTAIALPADAAVESAVQVHLNSVACSTPDGCAAVGDFPATSGGVHAMAALEVAGTWGAATDIVLPTGAVSSRNATLTNVWCDASADCIAVGEYTSATGVAPFVVREASGIWSGARRLPLASGLKAPFTYAVSGLACSSVANCTLIGSYEGSGDDLAVQFGEREVTGTWGPLQPIPLHPSSQLSLAAVACPSPTTCIAVGQEFVYVTRHGAEFSSTYPVAVLETSGAWHAARRFAPPVLSPLTSTADLTSISCVAGGTCETVGDAYNMRRFERYPFAVSFASGAWSSGALQRLTPLGTTGNADFSTFDGVSCSDTVSCTAIGQASLNPWSDPPYAYQPVFPFSTAVTVTRAIRAPGAPIDVRVVLARGQALVGLWSGLSPPGRQLSLITTGYPVRVLGRD